MWPQFPTRNRTGKRPRASIVVRRASAPKRLEAIDLLSSLILENGRSWGQAATPVQWLDARAILAEDGRPYHFLTRSRGYSKTSDLSAVVLSAMLVQLPPGSRCYALAADKDQGRLILDSITGFIARTPGLRGALDLAAYKVADPRTGSSLEILAADAPGAYGLRPSFLVVDEIAQWSSTPEPRRLFEAMSSAMGKVPGSRMVVITSAGTPGHWSYKILEHARNHALWRTSEIMGPAPWMKAERLEEQRARLTESSFLRLFENVWAAAEDTLANPDDLRACVTLDGPQERQDFFPYAIGLDVGLTRDQTAVAVCHLEPASSKWEAPDPWTQPIKVEKGSKVVLDRMAVFQGSRAHPLNLQLVEDWVLQAGQDYRCPVIFDPYQATGMMQRLNSRQIRTEQFNFTQQSVGKLASTLYQLIRNRSLALPADEDLLDELANVRILEPSPGMLRIDHDAGKHDDRVIALALAAHHLLQAPPPAHATWGRMKIAGRCVR